jgi:hypothetical protein
MNSRVAERRFQFLELGAQRSSRLKHSTHSSVIETQQAPGCGGIPASRRRV